MGNGEAARVYVGSSAPEEKASSTIRDESRAVEEETCPIHLKVLSVINNSADAMTAVEVLGHLSGCKRCAENLTKGIDAQRRFIKAAAQRIVTSCPTLGGDPNKALARAQELEARHENHFARLEKIARIAKK